MGILFFAIFILLVGCINKIEILFITPQCHTVDILWRKKISWWEMGPLDSDNRFCINVISMLE